MSKGGDNVAGDRKWTKRSLSKELTTSLNKDGRFVYYPEMDYRVNKGDSHRVSQFDFFLT